MKILKKIVLMILMLLCVPISTQAKDSSNASIQRNNMARVGQAVISDASSQIWWNISKTAVSTQAENGDLPYGIKTLYQNNSYYFNIQFASSQIKVKKVDLWLKSPNVGSYSKIYTNTASTNKIMNYRNYLYNFSVTGTYNYYWVLTYSGDGTQTLPVTTFTVKSKKTMSVSASSYNGTYDGYSHTIPLNVSGTGNYKIYYSTSKSLNSSNYSTYGSTIKPTRTSAGKTTVYFYIKDLSGEYNDFADFWVINISKANMCVSASSYEGRYDGYSHTISLGVSNLNSYTIYYSTSRSLNSSNYSTYGSTIKPTRTQPGTDTVYYYIKDNTGNYNDYSGSRVITVKAKKTMNVSASSYQGTYDGYSHTIPITVVGPSNYRIYYSTSTRLDSSNFSRYGVTTKPTRTSVGETKVYCYIRDLTGEYNDFADYWYITIYERVKSNMSVNASSYVGTYDGFAHTISISVSGPSSYRIYYSTSTRLDSLNYSRYGVTTKPTRTGVGCTKVYFYIKDLTGNYNDFSDYWYINVNKANMSVTESSYSGKYNGVAHSITLKVLKPSSYKIYYSTSKNLTSSNYTKYGKTTKPTRKSKGTTTVYYYIKDKTGNYNDYAGNKTITITSTATVWYVANMVGYNNTQSIKGIDKPRISNNKLILSGSFAAGSTLDDAHQGEYNVSRKTVQLKLSKNVKIYYSGGEISAKPMSMSTFKKNYVNRLSGLSLEIKVVNGLVTAIYVCS